MKRQNWKTKFFFKDKTILHLHRVPQGQDYEGGFGIVKDPQTFQNQVKTYQLILRQLDIEQLSKTDINTGISFNEQNKNLSLKDYMKLLKEVKKRLQEFKLVLANKIGSSR